MTDKIKNLSMGELARRTQAAAAALNGEIDPAARVLRDWIEEKIMRLACDGGGSPTDSQWQMIKDQAFEVLDHALGEAHSAGMGSPLLRCQTWPSAAERIMGDPDQRRGRDVPHRV